MSSRVPQPRWSADPRRRYTPVSDFPGLDYLSTPNSAKHIGGGTSWTSIAPLHSTTEPTIHPSLQLLSLPYDRLWWWGNEFYSKCPTEDPTRHPAMAEFCWGAGLLRAWVLEEGGERTEQHPSIPLRSHGKSFRVLQRRGREMTGGARTVSEWRPGWCAPDGTAHEPVKAEARAVWRGWLTNGAHTPLSQPVEGNKLKSTGCEVLEGGLAGPDEDFGPRTVYSFHFYIFYFPFYFSISIFYFEFEFVSSFMIHIHMHNHNKTSACK
jgi:hypothetical protein